MKTFKIVLFTVLTIFAATSIAQAAGQIQMNQSTTVSVDVQNDSRRDVRAAVKLSGYDSKGNSVGHLCREVRLKDRSVTTVDYTWQAPGYETGLYWSPKVEVDGSCPGSDKDDDDDDDHHHH